MTRYIYIRLCVPQLSCIYETHRIPNDYFTPQPTTATIYTCCVDAWRVAHGTDQHAHGKCMLASVSACMHVNSFVRWCKGTRANDQESTALPETPIVRSEAHVSQKARRKEPPDRPSQIKTMMEEGWPFTRGCSPSEAVPRVPACLANPRSPSAASGPSPLSSASRVPQRRPRPPGRGRP
jgi:hypothetical protein